MNLINIHCLPIRKLVQIADNHVTRVVLHRAGPEVHITVISEIMRKSKINKKRYVLLFGCYLSLFSHNPNIFSVIDRCYHLSQWLQVQTTVRSQRTRSLVLQFLQYHCSSNCAHCWRPWKQEETYPERHQNKGVFTHF
jgi:hypothetical protein